MKAKTSALFVIFMFLSVFFCGCWDKQELSDTAIVLGLGIDPAKEGLCLTVEIAYGKGVEAEGESYCFTAQGESFADAEKQLMQQLDKHLFWGHLAVLLFGGSLTKGEIQSYALYFYEDARFHSALPLLQAEGNAADVLRGKFGESDYVSAGLAQALTRDKKAGDLYTLPRLLQQICAGESFTELPSVMVLAEGAVTLKGDE